MDQENRTREKILEAVLFCKGEDPCEEPQLTQIAAKAGISVRTLNRYYPNKEDMVALAYLRFLKQKYDATTQGFETQNLSGLSGYEQLCAFFDYSQKLRQNNPTDVIMTALAYLKCIQFGLKEPKKIQDFSRRGCNLVSELLKRGQRDGSIRAELNVAATTDLIEAGFNGVMEKIAMSCGHGMKEADRARALSLSGEFLKMLEWYVSPKKFTPECPSTDRR